MGQNESSVPTISYHQVPWYPWYTCDTWEETALLKASLLVLWLWIPPWTKTQPGKQESRRRTDGSSPLKALTVQRIHAIHASKFNVCTAQEMPLCSTFTSNVGNSHTVPMVPLVFWEESGQSCAPWRPPPTFSHPSQQVQTTLPTTPAKIILRGVGA